MSFNLMMVNDRFTTVINNKPYTVNYDHPKFDELLECAKSGDAAGFKRAYTAARVVEETFENTTVQLKNGEVLYNGEVLHNAITKRIVEFAERSLPVEPMLAFLGNLMENPSRRALNELYGFLEHRNMPITEDGCFLAYKAVKENYLDKYSGTFDNSVGAINEMPRNQVDDDCGRTCSVGFHVGALAYAGPGGAFYSPGDKVMIVKVNPRDAVSVPIDHSAQKLRVCRYEVVGEYDKPLDDAFDTSFDDCVQRAGDSDEESEVKQNESNFVLNSVFDDLEKFLTDVAEPPAPHVVEKLTANLGYIKKCFSHTETNPNTRLKREVKTKRRIIQTKPDRYVEPRKCVVCYNTDDTVRWVSIDTGAWDKDFYRYTDAR